MARTKKNVEADSANMSELDKVKAIIEYHERCLDKARAKLAELENKEKDKQVKAVLASMSAEEIAAKLGIKL